MNRRAVVIGVILLAALGGLGYLLVGGGAEDLLGDDEPTPPTTEVELPTGNLAPLTGLPVDDDELERLARPALAAKVDNHPLAVPQWGLSAADVVIEVQVEGISRFLAVFHSTDVGEVGPIRSARTSDPDLLAMFGRPLTSWSGANPGTRQVMRSTEWIQDVSADELTDAYRRDSRTSAPHNLVLDARRAFDVADDPPRVPQPLFEYRQDDDAPQGLPVAGVVVGVGLSRSEYVWDADRGGWLRWSDGEPLHDADRDDGNGPQIAPANVLVLETPYGASSADRSSPEARSVGEGRAWVFSAGHLVEGRWSRGDRAAPWALTADDGAPIRLSPGRTWIAMPPEGQLPEVLDEAEAGSVRSGG